MSKRKLTLEDLQRIVCEDSDSNGDFEDSDFEYSTESQRIFEREKVVSKLVSTICEKDVCLAFDRFFTSMNLLQTIAYPALGTYMQNRKNTPKFVGKLNRGESQLQTNTGGILAARWMDSKEVLLASNCHAPSLVDIDRKQKDGSKKKIKCPESIKDYNRIMGGVDLADQKTTVYDFNRKSSKWWKKVFFKLLMASVVNSWIV